MAKKTAVPTVYLVDDDASVRDSIKLLLKSVEIPLRGFANGKEFLDEFDPFWPGCIALDVRMPGISGMDILDELNRVGNPLPVILVTGHGDIPMAIKALRMGAFEFLEKPYNEHALIDAVQHAFRENEVRRKHYKESTQVHARLERLTPKEREVFDLMAQGKQNRDIATLLKISRKTLDIHRAKVLQKMEAEGVGDLVRMAHVVKPS